jgi:hypothetical protein
MEKKPVEASGYKQMIILIDPELLQDIKTRAIFNNTSLKGWVLQAIIEKTIREDKTK